jgi:hypothetical protein
MYEDDGVRSFTLNYFGGEFPVGFGACNNEYDDSGNSIGSQNIIASTGIDKIYVLDAFTSDINASFSTFSEYYGYQLAVYNGGYCEGTLKQVSTYYFTASVTCVDENSGVVTVFAGGIPFRKHLINAPLQNPTVNEKFSLSW